MPPLSWDRLSIMPSHDLSKGAEMLKSLTMACLSLAAVTACATKPASEVEELRVNQKVKMIGAPEEKLRVCVLTIKNIITVAPSPVGPLSTEEAMGEKAILCGEMDCTEIAPDQKGFVCAPFSATQSPKSE